jgi:hypothetical protein
MERTDTTRNILHGFIWNRYGYEVIQDGSGKLTFNIEKIEADATEQAKKYFSQEDREYFSLLQDVVQAYESLRTFEKAHDYVPYSNRESFMQNLKGGFSPYWFAFSWEIGKMSKQGKEMLEELENE